MIEYDKEADALYVRYTDHPVEQTVWLKETVLIDYDGDNQIVGIEILSVSSGINLVNVPSRAFLEELLVNFLPKKRSVM